MHTIDRSKKFEMDPDRVINGTFVELWMDSDYMAEATAVKAEVELKETDVQQCGKLTTGKKTTGLDCKGSVKLNKCTSYFAVKLSNNLKKGKATVFDMVAKLDDPAAYGAERIKLIGCKFNKLKLIDCEAEKLCEDEMEFSFTDWTYLDLIK